MYNHGKDPQTEFASENQDGVRPKMYSHGVRTSVSAQAALARFSISQCLIGGSRRVYIYIYI